MLKIMEMEFKIMGREFKKCGTCKEHHWTNQHCLPEWKVFHEDNLGDDFKLMRAANAEGAALAYASHYNTSSDYGLMNEEIDIFVEEKGVNVKFVVGAEPDIHYTVKKV